MIDILMRYHWIKSQCSRWGESLNIAFVLWPTFCFLFCLHQFVCNSSLIAFLFELWRQNTKDLTFENFRQMEGG